MKKNITLFFALFSIIVQAQNFNPGNIIVTQIGNGTTTLSGNTAPVSLLEFAPTGTGQSPVKTVTLNTGSGTKLVLTGTTQSEGQLSLSSDGKYLSLIGYNIPTTEVTTNNCVSNSLTLTAGGSGYTSSPTVTISAPNIAGGVQATAWTSRSGGVITSIYMTNNGSGYTSVPTITITGGGGTGATATASLQSPYWWGSAITKTIARIDNTGIADYSTAISTNPSSALLAAKQAVSVDGSSFWASTNILDYVVFGSSSNTNISTSISPQGMVIYNNKLYLGAQKSYSNISYYGSMPTTATAPTNMVTQSANSYQSIVLFDLDATANWNGTGFDVMYVGDKNNSLTKYYWNGTAWTSLGTTWIGTLAQITGKLNVSGQPIIYGITSITGTGSSSKLISFTDVAAYNVAMTGSPSITTLATANNNYAFRGLAFAPQGVPDAPNIGTASVSGISGQASVPFTAPSNNGGSAITSYTATSSPGGITGTLTQAGSGTITVNGLTNGTAYTFTVKANNAAGASTASSASNSVTPKGSSSISVTGTTSFTYNGSAQGPATSSVTGSTGTVTYSYVGVSGTSYSANATAPTSVGSYSVTASVAADANYNGASSSATGFTIAKANSSISITGTTSFNYDGSAQGPATSNVTGSTGSVTYSYAGTGYGPSDTAPTNAGNYTVTASLAEDANYNGASSSATDFTIAKASQTVNFGTLSNLTVGDADFSLGATSTTSGVNAITYASSNEAVATIVDGKIHLVGAGSTTITASQASSTNYNAATNVDQNLTVLAGSVTVSSDANLSSYTTTSATDVTVSAGELTVDANASVKTLTVAPGAKLTLASGKTLNVAGALTLQSSATATATLVDNGGTLYAGSTNVEQYLTSGRNWYVSSPVSGATSNVFSASAGNPLYWYDEAHGSTVNWPTITNTTTDLTVMKGYVTNVPSSGVITFSGSLNTGAKSIDVTRTAGQTKEGFNLVGNPYPSYLNWTNVIKTNLSTTLWYRTKTAPAPVTGATTYVFDTYNANGGLGTSLGAKAVTNMIPPMQSFWVRVDAGQTSGTFAVTNSHRAHADNGSNGFKSKSSTESTQPVLRLEVSNGVNSDQALIYYNAAASNGLDGYDSPKLSNETASTPEIYTLAGTEQVTINGVNDLTQMTLGFTTGEANNFTIKVSQFTNFVSGTQIILRDNVVNAEQDLTVADYKFYSDATANNETRFTILVKAPSVATGINHNSNGNVWISLANNQIVVNGATGETSVAVYNEVGQRLAFQRLKASTKSVGTFVPGVYMVTITNAGKSVTEKVIIK